MRPVAVELGVQHRVATSHLKTLAQARDPCHAAFQAEARVRQLPRPQRQGQGQCHVVRSQVAHYVMEALLSKLLARWVLRDLRKGLPHLS